VQQVNNSTRFYLIDSLKDFSVFKISWGCDYGSPAY